MDGHKIAQAGRLPWPCGPGSPGRGRHTSLLHPTAAQGGRNPAPRPEHCHTRRCVENWWPGPAPGEAIDPTPWQKPLDKRMQQPPDPGGGLLGHLATFASGRPAGEHRSSPAKLVGALTGHVGDVAVDSIVFRWQDVPDHPAAGVPVQQGESGGRVSGSRLGLGCLRGRCGGGGDLEAANRHQVLDSGYRTFKE